MHADIIYCTILSQKPTYMTSVLQCWNIKNTHAGHRPDQEVVEQQKAEM
jgi:hypothetical protein